MLLILNKSKNWSTFKANPLLWPGWPNCYLTHTSIWITHALLDVYIVFPLDLDLYRLAVNTLPNTSRPSCILAPKFIHLIFKGSTLAVHVYMR